MAVLMLGKFKSMFLAGTGNHSRGQASLPSAVKSFLIENG